MELFCLIIFFIIGTVFGSFYNVVGYRLPKGESIIAPPSHCPNCDTKLGALELFPILSYLFQKGKCKHCKAKISPFYTVFELLTGLLFLLSYISFGFSLELIIALTFISMLIIIVVSDYNYMIISDEVLIFFGILLGIEIFFINGPDTFVKAIASGILAFVTMFLIKKLGDILFKKESMGGGDIKLMFIFGLVLGYPMAILSIFVGSIIGLPISLILLKKNTDHIIPFGPFLAAGAIIILLLHIDMNTILNLYNI